MKTTPKIILTVFVVMLALLFTSVVRGAETTLIVDLQKKIKSDFIRMEQVNLEQEAKAERLNNEIKDVVTKLTNTADDDRKEELKKLYFKKRAQYLQAEALRVVEIEASLSRIIKNMVTLDKEMGKLGLSNNLKGLTSSDTEAIKSSLRGMANIIAPLQALKANDPRIVNMAMTLTNLDMQYKTYFTYGRKTTLKNQIAYLEDLHAYVHSARGLLKQETIYLKSNVFYMMKDGIVRVINDFQKNFYATTFKGFETQHRQDEEVLGEREDIETDEYQNKFDLDKIGNW